MASITNHTDFAEHACLEPHVKMVPRYRLTENEFDSLVHRGAGAHGDHIRWNSRGPQDVYMSADFGPFHMAYRANQGYSAATSLAGATHGQAVVIDTHCGHGNTPQAYRVIKAILDRLAEVDRHAHAETGSVITPANQGFDNSVDSALRQLVRAFF